MNHLSKRRTRQVWAVAKFLNETAGPRGVLIPEILSMVFSSLRRNFSLNDSQGDLFTAALVCGSWSQVALDELWRELPHLHLLLAVLAPMAKVNGTWVSSFTNAYASGDSPDYCRSFFPVSDSQNGIISIPTHTVSAA